MQRPHRDVLRRPRTDAGQAKQRVDLLLDIRCKRQYHFALEHCCAQRGQAAGARAHNAEGRDFVCRNRRHVLRARAETIERGIRRRDGDPESLGPPAGQRRRALRFGFAQGAERLPGFG